MRMCVGAIFKNEAPYLKEWLDHYINRGVDHFYLIDDNSDDNYKEVLEPYIQKGYITLFNVDEVKTYFGRQEYFYKKFLFPIKDYCEYMIICDIDEYIWSPKHFNLFDAAKEMAAKNIQSYQIPMVLFGSNNYKFQPQNIVNSFNTRADYNIEYYQWALKFKQFKSIFLTKNIKQIGVHFTLNNFNFSPDSLDLNSHLFRLNHYRLQSEEKWHKVINKSDCNFFNPSAWFNLKNDLLYFCPGLDSSNYLKIKRYIHNNNLNYRSMYHFKAANKIQNNIKDLDLINQNNNIL